MALAGTLALGSCADDFLSQENSYQLNQETFFDSDEALTAATAPLYSYVWYNFNDKFYYGMGDGRANNITAQYSDYIYPYTNFTETSLSSGLSDAWSSFYSVVAQSNNTINNIDNYSSASVSETAKLNAKAEARFMRGLAYWYIGSLWNCGIIYTNTDDLVNNYVVKAQPVCDVMEFAIRDMEYAAMYLPTTQTDKGRVTKYAAYAMLSRFYLSMAGLTTSGAYDGTNVAQNMNRGTRNEYYLTLAKNAAKTVIDSKAYSLVAEYGDLFAPELAKFNNNSESIFQLQFMTGTNVGGAAQSMTRFLGWSAMVSDTNAWGGATYCSYDLWEEFKEYEDKTLGVTIDDATRRHHCVASYGETYPELGDYTYGVTESAGNQGANVKKYVVGIKKVNGFSEVNNSGVNTYMMRLAEVYLNYAEAVMGNNASISDKGTAEEQQAVSLLNDLRTRAKVAKKSTFAYEDMRHEFRCELAFEGLYWYYLVRRAYYQQQEVLNYVNNQNRNASYYEASTHTYELSDSYVAPGSGVDIADESNLKLPMADVDQTKNPNLKTDSSGNISTEAYTFGDREVTPSQLGLN